MALPYNPLTAFSPTTTNPLTSASQVTNRPITAPGAFPTTSYATNPLQPAAAAPRAPFPTSSTLPTAPPVQQVSATKPAQGNPAVSGLSGAPSPFAPAPFTPSTTAPTTPPGNNMLNPGLGEQAFNSTQNRLMEDPYAQQTAALAKQAQAPSQGENYLNQNLGSLQGPGQGEQYWNQVQGQFNDPFAGEQFARQATQQMGAQGPASSFFNQAQGQYGNFTGYQGPQNTQGQFQQNAASGPLAGQQFYNQVQGQAGTTGKYTDPNLAAGQYAQTQQAFGDLPIANFDPFYDRASQLGVQNYNKQAAGRGVYGSSEALSGVGNIITDIEAQRANRSFDAEMQRAQEQRARQGLLGEQARAGDLSSLAGFGANLAGLETFGNLANMAGNQTLGQQTMLGQQANAADTQALGAQQANISGLNAFGNLSANADTAETNRFQARTNAMNQADRTGLDRISTGADIAFRGDDSKRADYATETGAAASAANIGQGRQQTASNIMQQGGAADLARLNSVNNQAQGAEGQRQSRQESKIRAISDFTRQVTNSISDAQRQAFANDAKAADDYFNSSILPDLQKAGMSQAEQEERRQAFKNAVNTGFQVADRVSA